ncbi:unnamed protein product [Brachionus calyciflorus]|uniref:Metalloendopeptidase n=1 Tax=Brachionus calyciflorus TaxID=104777 RepID=A0A813M223_9BILA|nr:unnamed protein product [Brachionus calyciflorus]
MSKKYLSFLIFFISYASPASIKKQVESRHHPFLIQGDIAFEMDRNSNIVTSYAGKWDNGIVPYKIDPKYPQQYKALIVQAMKVIEVQTRNCIRFVEYSPSQNFFTWLYFTQDNGCWSYIGKGKGEQWLSLVPGCMTQSIIIHEVLHALGFWHEQSRPDRDSYITINWSNIMPGYEAEFNKRPDAIDTMNIQYDYFSIMHYAFNTFALNTSLPTMIPTQPNINMYDLGTRDNLSETDIDKIKKYYNCY